MTTVYSGAEWIEKQKGIKLPEFQTRVANMLGIVFRGIYHIGNEVMRADWLCKHNEHEHTISITASDGRGRFSTYDSSTLTELVLLAHKMNIRVSIFAATHGYLRLVFMEVGEWGFFEDAHPTLEQAVANLEDVVGGR